MIKFRGEVSQDGPMGLEYESPRTFPPLFPLSRFPRSPLPSRAIWRNDPVAMVKPWEEKVGKFCYRMAVLIVISHNERIQV